VKVNPQNFGVFSEIIQQEKLLNDEELKITNGLTKTDFAFAPPLVIADNIHYHIHLPDMEKLPHALFGDKEGKVEKPAKVKIFVDQHN
jgi:hypothetical protein